MIACLLPAFGSCLVCSQGYVNITCIWVLYAVKPLHSQRGHRCMSPRQGGKISILLFVLYFKLFPVPFLTVISGFLSLDPAGGLPSPQTLCMSPLNEILATPLQSRRFSACRRVDLKARRAGVNHGFDGGWRFVSLVTTGAYLSSKEDRVELYAMRREPSDFEGSVVS